MKKAIIVTLLLSLVFLTFALIPFPAAAQTVSGPCGNGVNWTFNTETNVLTVSGSGAMENLATERLPWSNYTSDIVKIKIEAGVTDKTEIPILTTVTGDANGDGIVNMKDISFLKAYIAGTEKDIYVLNADIDCSGNISIMDLSLLKTLIAG